jgi:ligand-binding SRPBCC domain-containing protein
MSLLERKLLINAPLKFVWDWIEWSPNLVGVWPNVISTVSYEQDDKGYGTQETIYMMSGMQFRVKARDIEKIPYERVVTRTESGINSTLTWVFTEVDGQTQIDFSAEYEVPIRALQGMAEELVKRLNEADLDSMLVNLKAKLEILWLEERRNTTS